MSWVSHYFGWLYILSIVAFIGFCLWMAFGKYGKVKLGKEEELKADLEARTGITIEKMEVGHIDYLRDAAFIKIWYKPTPGETNTIGTFTKIKDFNV